MQCTFFVEMCEIEDVTISKYQNDSSERSPVLETELPSPQG